MKKWMLALTLMLPQLAFAQVRILAGVRVGPPPPAYRVEAPPPAPTRRHQWIAGYWIWRGGKYVWAPGHWAVPPGPSYVWEPPRYLDENGGQVFYDGHWRAGDDPSPTEAYQPPAPPVAETVVEVPPPPPANELRPPMPFNGAVWIPGFWQWSGGRHLWVAGRWSAQPPGYRWEDHHWDHRGDGRWVHRPGHWDHRDDRGGEGDRGDHRGEGDHRDERRGGEHRGEGRGEH